METGKQNKTAQYALIQGIYWMSFCMIFAYASVYLLDKGLSNTAIGMLIGISGTVSAILQPWIGGMADGEGKISLKTMIMLIGGLMFAVGICLLLVSKNHVLTVLCYGVEVTFLQVLTPLIYSLGMGCVNQGIKLNFGLARGIGSLAYAAISYVAGFVVASVGTMFIPAAIAVIYGLLLAAVWFFRYREEDETPAVFADVFAGDTAAGDGAAVAADAAGDAVSAGAAPVGPRTPFFKRYPMFFTLLAGGVLVFVSHNMLSNFAYQIMETKGGDSSAMGTAIALAAASELPTMFLFGWMVKQAGCDVWLRISGLFFVIKSLATVLVTDVAGMYLIQGLQMFGFALFVVASVYYVNAIMDEKDRVKGQAYMTMTNTLGGVLGSACGGAIIDGLGVQTLLVVSTAVAAGGMVLMGISTKKRSMKKR